MDTAPQGNTKALGPYHERFQTAVVQASDVGFRKIVIYFLFFNEPISARSGLPLRGSFYELHPQETIVES